MTIIIILIITVILIDYNNSLKMNYTIRGHRNKSNKYSIFPPDEIISNLCTLDEIYNGTWTYNNRLSSIDDSNLRTTIIRDSMIKNISITSSSYTTFNHSNGIFNGLYNSCPKTFQTIMQTVYLKDQLFKYSCNYYYNATYHTNNKCTILNPQESLQLFYHFKVKYQHHVVPPKIMIVGDSLSGQMYITLKCMMESFNIMSKIDYSLELFYLPNIPCSDQCLTDIKFREKNVANIINPCAACPDGIKQNFSINNIFFKSFKKDYWYNKITPETRILILGGGSWFNYYKGVINSTETYKEMLMFVGKLVLVLKHEKIRGLEVYWIDLPPIIPGTQNKVYPKYEWDDFQNKNDLASKILPAYGIHVLNTNKAVYSRKAHDIYVSEPSTLHWCNPGSFSVPYFQGTSILHLYIRSLLKVFFHDILI